MRSFLKSPVGISLALPNCTHFGPRWREFRSNTAVTQRRLADWHPKEVRVSMQLTVNGTSALAVLRAIRSGKCPACGSRVSALSRCDIAAPALDEGAKWTRRRLDLSSFGAAPASKEHPTQVAVPTSASRIRSPYAHTICYTRKLPEGSFVDTGAGLVISSPELLFVEMSKVMDPAALALLGYELCGTFSRDPVDPRIGEAALGVEPVTSVARIAAFLKAYGGKLSVPHARAALAAIADNAWSPMEAVVAALMSLPVTEYGYGLGPLVLNQRVSIRSHGGDQQGPATRVPDILVAGTTVGINYDGHEHLDLDALAEQAAATIDGTVGEAALERTKRQIREKVRDDLLRDRQLAASGLMVLPVTSDDLFAPGATDALMSVVCDLLEQRDDRDVSQARGAIASRALRRRRQLRVWSLLPWADGETYARELRLLERHSLEQAHVKEYDLRWL